MAASAAATSSRDQKMRGSGSPKTAGRTTQK